MAHDLRRAWLLGGGGAAAAVQVEPMLRAVREHGYPDTVSGGSAGAIHGLFVAQQQLGLLRAMWEEVEGSRFFQSPNLDFWNGLFNLKPLHRKIKHFADPSLMIMPFFVGMTDLAKERYKSVLVNELTRNEIADAIVCSSTNCGFHEKSFWEGSPMGDGMILRQVPDLPGWRGFDEIHCFLCLPVKRRNPVKPEDVGHHWSRALEILLDRIAESDMQRLQSYANAGKRVYVYAPDQLYGSTFEASADITKHRLNVIGKQVWESRQMLEPSASSIVRSIRVAAGASGLRRLKEAVDDQFGITLEDLLLRRG